MVLERPRLSVSGDSQVPAVTVGLCRISSSRSFGLHLLFKTAVNGSRPKNVQSHRPDVSFTPEGHFGKTRGHDMSRRRLIALLVALSTVLAPAEADAASAVLRLLIRGGEALWTAGTKAITEVGDKIRRLTTDEPSRTPTDPPRDTPQPPSTHGENAPDLDPDRPAVGGLHDPSERSLLGGSGDGGGSGGHVPPKMPQILDDNQRIAVIRAATFSIQGIRAQSELVIGRQADIDALLNAGIIRRVIHTEEVPKNLRHLRHRRRLHPLPENRVVIVVHPAQAEELFNRLKSPRVQTKIHPYSNGRATLSVACELCTPTAAIGYGDGHISFAGGCHSGVKIEVSTTGSVKSSLSNGPYSATVGVATDANQHHAEINYAINTPAGVSASASAGCRNGVKPVALGVSATAVELSVTLSAPARVSEVNNVSERLVALVGTAEARDKDRDEPSDSIIGDMPEAIAEQHSASGQPVPASTTRTMFAAQHAQELPARDSSAFDVILAEWVCTVNADRRRADSRLWFGNTSCAWD